MTSISLIVGTRYARGKKRNRFGSVVSLFSLVGMAMGVVALIVVMSVMNGFNQEIKLRFQTVAPHLSLIRTSADASDINDFLSGQSDSLVEAWSPLVEGYGLLSTDYAQAPAVLNGISPFDDQAVVPLQEKLIYGSMDQLKPGEYGLVLGSYLARLLYLQPGDSVQLVLPDIQVRPTGLYPRQKRFVVVGIFDSGSQLDGELAYLHIEDAARLLRVDTTGYSQRIRVVDENRISAFIEHFEQSQVSQGWRIETWSSKYESLFAAMKMEKVTVGLLLLIIVLVAAFNIISGLVMMVSDKRSDMAVIRTMGASTATVMKIFVVQGLILGVSGIIIGGLVGSLLAFNLSEIVNYVERLFGAQLFDPNVFYVSFLPTQWMWSDFFWVTGAAFLMTVVATLIPAWQASKITPTEALAYKN